MAGFIGDDVPAGGWFRKRSGSSDAMGILVSCGNVLGIAQAARVAFRELRMGWAVWSNCRSWFVGIGGHASGPPAFATGEGLDMREPQRCCNLRSITFVTSRVRAGISRKRPRR